MVVTPSDMFKEDRLPHPLKASFSIVVTLPGMVTEVKLIQFSKEQMLRVVTLLGILAVVML